MITSHQPDENRENGFCSITTNPIEKDSMTIPVGMSENPFSAQQDHMKLMVEIDAAHGLIQDNQKIK